LPADKKEFVPSQETQANAVFVTFGRLVPVIDLKKQRRTWWPIPVKIGTRFFSFFSFFHYVTF
jgi:hypothetical protein